MAISLAASALTENQIIALVLGAMVSLGFFLAGYEKAAFLAPAALRPLLGEVSLAGHFQSILTLSEHPPTTCSPSLFRLKPDHLCATMCALSRHSGYDSCLSIHG